MTAGPCIPLSCQKNTLVLPELYNFTNIAMNRIRNTGLAEKKGLSPGEGCKPNNNYTVLLNEMLVFTHPAII